MSKPEMYISIDIETDGPCPGLNSMLSLGAVAYLDNEEISFFDSNIKPLEGGHQNKDTMAWWKTQPEAWEYASQNQISPGMASIDFARWLAAINLGNDRGERGYTLIAAAWPATFDFGFVNWYMHKFYGENPLGFACLDIRSYANGLFGNHMYYKTRATVAEGDLYKFFGIDTTYYKHHIAVEDARKQGDLLMGLLGYAKKKATGEVSA